MNIILLEKMGKLGDIGDTAEVKAGFARNYLFPKAKAVPATAANLEDFERRRADLLSAHDENTRKAQARGAMVEGLALRIEANASDEGRLYGSVGTRDIAAGVNALAAEAEVTKSEVLLPHGVIRQTGDYDIALDLGYEVTATVKLTVAAHGKPAEVTDDGSVIEDMEAAEAAEAADDEGTDTASVESSEKDEAEAKSE